MKKVMQIAVWFMSGAPGAATQCRLTVACILGVLSLTAAASGTLPKLKVSDNRRFLATAEGKPFFYLADTAWELFHRLTREEFDRSDARRFTPPAPGELLDWVLVIRKVK